MKTSSCDFSNSSCYHNTPLHYSCFPDAWNIWCRVQNIFQFKKEKKKRNERERDRKTRKGHQVWCRTVISCVGITGSMTRDLEFLPEIKPEQFTFCFCSSSASLWFGFLRCGWRTKDVLELPFLTIRLKFLQMGVFFRVPLGLWLPASSWQCCFVF